MANEDALTDVLKVTTAAVLLLLEDAIDNQAGGNPSRAALLQNLHSEVTAAKARLDNG